MITEDYVSFETAKLLKEKGFDWNTDKQFNLDKIVSEYNITDRSRYPERYLDAPTLQMAMKWLREVYNLAIGVEYFVDEENGDTRTWRYDIISMNTFCNKSDYRLCRNFTTYEEACEAAIKYCLENLI